MNEPLYWTLDGHTPIPCWDAIEWLQWANPENCRVAKSSVLGITVSTVFLGRNHNFFCIGPPILFETMCYTDPDYLDIQIRYATWEEAETGHQRVVEMLRSSLPV